MANNHDDSQQRTEPILVLYGSQTGNSEQAAKDMCDQMITRLSPSELSKLTNNNDKNITNVLVKPIHMQLDDFLELHHCQWTRLFVIVVSSYGTGQAPLGSYRFRELCDALLKSRNKTNDTIQPDGLEGSSKTLADSVSLSGTYYAMCGLGDSKYPTFFNNPTVIDDGLRHAGSKRVGALGKADASGKDENQQSLVIERWMNDSWKELANVIVNQPVISNEALVIMQKSTLELCTSINPDLQSIKKMTKKVHSNNSSETFRSLLSLEMVTIIIALLAVIASFYLF